MDLYTFIIIILVIIILFTILVYGACAMILYKIFSALFNSRKSSVVNALISIMIISTLIGSVSLYYYYQPGEKYVCDFKNLNCYDNTPYLMNWVYGGFGTTGAAILITILYNMSSSKNIKNIKN